MLRSEDVVRVVYINFIYCTYNRSHTAECEADRGAGGAPRSSSRSWQGCENFNDKHGLHCHARVRAVPAYDGINHKGRAAV